MKHTCTICNKKVAKNKLIADSSPWHCVECINKTLPFSNLNNSLLASMLLPRNNEKPILSKCPKHLKSLFKNLNDVSTAAIDCKYYDIEDLNRLSSKSNSSHFVHLNISSLPFHIDELKLMINSMDFIPEVIGITESRIKKDKQSITDITLDNYLIEHTPTEASNGGTLLYINSKCSYKTRHDLEIYKPKELESTFIELIYPFEKNIIVGCIYRHPCMSVQEFNNNYLNKLLEKLNKEKKKDYAHGRFQY